MPELFSVQNVAIELDRYVQRIRNIQFIQEFGNRE